MSAPRLDPTGLPRPAVQPSGAPPFTPIGDATLVNMDGTHAVIDGPRVGGAYPGGAAVLSWETADDPQDILDANRRARDATGSFFMNAMLTLAPSLNDKWYFEWYIENAPGSPDQQAVGVVNSAFVAANAAVGRVADSWGANMDGFVFAENVQVQDHSAAVSFTVGRVWGMAYDAATGNAWFRYEGAWLNGSDPSSGVNPDFTATGTGIEVLVSVNAFGGLEFDFGQREFTYQPPTGFDAPGGNFPTRGNLP